VFTFSIHQANNYPYPKPPSNIDIELPDQTGDEDYLARLESHLIRAFDEFHPDLLFYLAGADPYQEDQLGGLALTLDGLRRRDRLVFEMSRGRGIPVAVTLAGGYARRVEDTVRIHVNTIVEAREVAAQASAGQVS
ncbi:MAG: histone deacetylase, partial [Acidobacteriota bacterium]|nr:histone deacetylase [Acidobacteriota bacterium]